MTRSPSSWTPTRPAAARLRPIGRVAELTNYYEQALRILGAYIDNQKAHDVFLFEQEGSFVLRLFGVSGSRAGHQLSEFTRDEILAMIESAPELRDSPRRPAPARSNQEETP